MILNRRLEAQIKALEKIADKEQAKEIRKIVKRTKKDQGDIYKELEKLYSRYEMDGEINYSQLVYDGALMDLDYKLALMAIKRYEAVTKAANRALHNVGYKTVETMRNLEEVGSIVKDIPVDHIVNKDMAGLNWTTRIGVNRQRAIGDLRGVLDEGLQKGKTITQMSRDLSKHMAGEVYQHERIIRTESHRIMTDVKLDAFRQIDSERPILKKWVSMMDERTREDHSDLDGVTIPIAEDFESMSGGRGQGPGQMNNAQDDINCRCILTMVVPKLERGREYGTDDYFIDT